HERRPVLGGRAFGAAPVILFGWCDRASCARTLGARDVAGRQLRERRGATSSILSAVACRLEFRAVFRICCRPGSPVGRGARGSGENDCAVACRGERIPNGRYYCAASLVGENQERDAEWEEREVQNGAGGRHQRRGGTGRACGG